MTIPKFLTQCMIPLMLLICFQSCKEKKQEADGEPTLEVLGKKGGFIQIFDGRTLNGWKGDPNYWRVENGYLVGEVSPETLLKNNTFLIWQGGQPDDFELKLEFRITESGNSGINYRSDLIDTIPNAMRGYQADIDGNRKYTGQNYEEKKRTTLAYRGEKVIIKSQENLGAKASLRANVKNNCWQSREVVGVLGEPDSLKNKIISEDWNKVHLVIQDNRFQHYVNGVLMSDVTDEDIKNRKLKGYLGVQVHVGPPMKAEYRNIQLKQL
ncbi:DUF1080 domain-containing protein [uncultured Zobellia sp.]|uniref:3-keto-disaccharide hydrolase n=1 Tax=uncultured Zobellia sp. TaxID=255433 RepID=UPI0025933FA8|nr:DUF1080 domain-containing protein [uncultured Zobellia sp.]